VTWLDAGTDIEQTAQPALCALAKHFGQCRFHRTIGNMHAAQAVPFFGMPREIFGGIGIARGADRIEMLAVLVALAAKARISAFGLAQKVGQRGQQSGTTALTQRRAQEYPAAFAAALGKPGVAQDLDMTRDARLALLEDLRQFADRKLHAGQQPHDPQAGGIGKSAKGIKHGHHEPI
jgi:hypothetical protein